MPATTELRLDRELIRLAASPADKTAAIREAGQLLVASGAVDPGYPASMIARERIADTYLGHGVAIPHGLGEDRHMVRRNGIAVLQIPTGVDWNVGQHVRLVIAIAASSDAHLGILRRLSGIIEDDALLARLAVATDPCEIARALTGRKVEASPARAPTDLAARFDWVLDYPGGLHARPAASWVASAKGLRGPVRVRVGDRVADARQLISLLRLGARQGETLVVSSDGTEAATTLERFRSAIGSLSAGERRDAAHAHARAAAAGIGWTPPDGPSTRRTITGLSGAPGLAVAPIHVVAERTLSVADEPAANEAGGLERGGRRLEDAIEVTRGQLAAIADDAGRRLGAADAAIFAAQAAILADTDLVTLACRLMVEGHGVAWSWHEAVIRTADQLASQANPVLAARAADLRDVGQRVLGAIDPSLAQAAAGPPDRKSVLIARDLMPSDTAGLDPTVVAGLATADGGPAAHTAILARTLGLPAVVACGSALLDATPGALAIVDGTGGRIHLDPSDADLAAARDAIAADARRHASGARARAAPAETVDGCRIAIGANINTPDQAAFAIECGAEGVGLMRTEFLFLARPDAPTEDEQAAIYAAMADRLGTAPSGARRTLVVRAFDIGGDKPVAHLALPREDNPALGLRGLRLLLRRPDLFEPQLRALHRAGRDRNGQIHLMLPMVTSVAEVREARAICERIRHELAAPPLPLGIMVEVPSAAIASAELAPHVDFFSIGTNDLTQYTLAIDRRNAALAAEADALHPAVLRLIRMTVEGARAHGRPTSVCGGLAGDPFGASILAGLGVDALSMTPRDIPSVKARLRASELAALVSLAGRALACETAEAVRALAV